ncbi:recombination protein NinG [Orbaceae bacterium ac157xtp]
MSKQAKKIKFKPNKPPKPKECAVCKNKFVPMRIGQLVCGYKCSTVYMKSPDNKVKEKVSRELNRLAKAELKKKKDSLKTRSERLKEAQIVFNAYIRERDKNEPCISCGRYHTGQYHAGHYRSVGACPELRFCELNVHKQCSACNNHKSGNILEYRINLVKK